MGGTTQRFELMVKSFSGQLYRYAFWLCRDEQLAQDLVQETFTRAWRSFESLRDPSKAKRWLLTTLRREHARQFERYQPKFQDIEMDTLPGESLAEASDSRIPVLRRAIAALPEKYREPLVLQVLGGYSCDEIGSMLELPSATVRTRLLRAREQLQAVFAQADGEAGTNVVRMRPL